MRGAANAAHVRSQSGVGVPIDQLVGDLLDQVARLERPSIDALRPLDSRAIEAARVVGQVERPTTAV